MLQIFPCTCSFINLLTEWKLFIITRQAQTLIHCYMYCISIFVDRVASNMLSTPYLPTCARAKGVYNNPYILKLRSAFFLHSINAVLSRLTEPNSPRRSTTWCDWIAMCASWSHRSIKAAWWANWSIGPCRITPTARPLWRRSGVWSRQSQAPPSDIRTARTRRGGRSFPGSEVSADTGLGDDCLGVRKAVVNDNRTIAHCRRKEAQYLLICISFWFIVAPYFNLFLRGQISPELVVSELYFWGAWLGPGLKYQHYFNIECHFRKSWMTTIFHPSLLNLSDPPQLDSWPKRSLVLLLPVFFLLYV